jgi:hypothetical protein
MARGKQTERVDKDAEATSSRQAFLEMKERADKADAALAETKEANARTEALLRKLQKSVSERDDEDRDYKADRKAERDADREEDRGGSSAGASKRAKKARARMQAAAPPASAAPRPEPGSLDEAVAGNNRQQFIHSAQLAVDDDGNKVSGPPVVKTRKAMHAVVMCNMASTGVFYRSSLDNHDIVKKCIENGMQYNCTSHEAEFVLTYRFNEILAMMYNKQQNKFKDDRKLRVRISANHVCVCCCDHC